jgi:hypothetical protein
VPFALSSFVVMVFPYGLFALAAVVLWRRRRTPATLLMALGFVATLVSEVTGFHVIHVVGVAARSHEEASTVLAHSHIVPLLTHYATLLGLWTAAMGMVWHAASR